MIGNPYEGTDYAESWRQGFGAGFTYPSRDNEAPFVLEGDQRTIYSEGVLAGNDAAARGLELCNVTPEGDIFAKTAGHVGEGVHALADVKHIIKVRELAAVGWGAFWGIALFAILGPDRSDEYYFDSVARISLKSAYDELSTSGLISTSVDLYMAACDSDHGANDGDALTRQGWWHGLVYGAFEPAEAEARNHEDQNNTRILRFQAGLDEIEMIALEP
ncbi:hypothetical protein [Streptomyces collinus]|uniref:hypothetical protein n=1 Tax=Streptomyces collinus TaxID=42684 RepID=UPI0033EA82FE